MTRGYGVSSWTAIISIIGDLIFRRTSVSTIFQKEDQSRIFRHDGID